MSTKQQVSLFLLLTFVIDMSLSEPAACKPQNRECSCTDTFLQDCGYFSPTESFQVERIEHCMDICQALNPFGQCEWLLYSPAMEDKSFIPTYPNCQLFGPNLASMEQYVNTCDRIGQPVRRHDGSCTANATNPSTGECNASRCPSGCAPCDQTDDCHRKYQETKCDLLGPVIKLFPGAPDLNFCLAQCAGTEDATYATWSHRDHTCLCYSSGERLCQHQAVQFGFSKDDIDQCIAEPGELATCNPQNRECSCADTSSRDCEDFFPSERFHVDNIEKCMELCQALNPLGQCEWLLFHYSPAKEELSFIPPYLNCELFAPDDASLEQYVNTCDKQGQPTRRHDGSCTVNATNPSTGECNTSICPSGCAPCDETDECHRKYHETECGMLSPAIRLEPNVPDFQFCLSMCAGTQDATYATWSHLDHTCTCYSSGERLCRRQAVQFGFSQDDIDQCIAEPGASEDENISNFEKFTIARQ